MLLRIITVSSNFPARKINLRMKAVYQSTVLQPETSIGFLLKKEPAEVL